MKSSPTLPSKRWIRARASEKKLEKGYFELARVAIEVANRAISLGLMAVRKIELIDEASAKALARAKATGQRRRRRILLAEVPSLIPIRAPSEASVEASSEVSVETPPPAEALQPVPEPPAKAVPPTVPCLPKPVRIEDDPPRPGSIIFVPRSTERKRVGHRSLLDEIEEIKQTQALVRRRYRPSADSAQEERDQMSA